MASCFYRNCFRLLQNIPKYNVTRFNSNHGSNNMKDEMLQSYLVSLGSKGFLRSHKAYDPPADTAKQIKLVCNKFMSEKELNTNVHRQKFKDREQRFKILTNCIKVFNHEIANSQLHKISTIGDLIDYFETPVKSTTCYEDLHALPELPPNLQMNMDYIRFHPETDSLFNGVSAYPGRSTVVSGLKSKKKYRGYTATTPMAKAPKY